MSDELIRQLKEAARQVDKRSRKAVSIGEGTEASGEIAPVANIHTVVFRIDSKFASLTPTEEHVLESFFATVKINLSRYRLKVVGTPIFLAAESNAQHAVEDAMSRIGYPKGFEPDVVDVPSTTGDDRPTTT